MFTSCSLILPFQQTAACDALSLGYASALTQRNGPAVAWTQSRDRDGSAWGLRVEMQFNATPVEGSCDVYRR